jgi:hypothetical protein
MSDSRRRMWTLVLVSLGLFMVVLDNLVVTVALPSIHRSLGASVQALEWTVTAYTLSYAVLLLTGAALGDRFGRKRTFMAGIGLFTLSSVAAALAPSAGLLIAARATQGAADKRAGSRRRDRHSAHAHPARRRLPARSARAGDRRLVGHQRHRDRARPACRRRRHPGRLLARHLLDQRPRRCGAGPAGRAQAA